MNAEPEEFEAGSTADDGSCEADDLAVFARESKDVFFDQPVLVQLVGGAGDRSPAYGPFDRFRVTAGIAHADDSEFARYVSTDQVWIDSRNRTWIAIRLLRPKP